MAIASIAILAVVTLVLADSDLTSSGHESEASSTSAIVSAVASTYRADSDWQPNDLASVRDLARAYGLGVELRTTAGVLLLDVPPPRAGGGTRTLPVVVDGRRIATAAFALPPGGLSPEELSFRHALQNAVVIASGIALLVALGAAVLGTRRLLAPVRSLTIAARRLAGGDRMSRVGELRATAELVELGHAFDKMADKLEREDALRQAVVADLSHELRTPLAVLQGELEGLAEGLVPLDQDAVGSLREEVGRLTRLIENLGVLSEAEAAGLSLHTAPVDLAEVASHAASRLASRFVEAGIELDTSFAEADVEGDADRLEQVVVNLLSNAAKFTPPGGTVRVVVASEGDDRFVVVADTGRGIPDDEQPLVFDRFFRGAGSTGIPGSGVGLAVVSALVVAHGGTIDLESTPGVGSVFTVHLPAP